jgi:hypothetical protein
MENSESKTRQCPINFSLSTVAVETRSSHQRAVLLDFCDKLKHIGHPVFYAFSTNYANLLGQRIVGCA